MPDVLVVDDEFAVRTLTARWLTAAGYKARVAENAEQARDEVALAPPDVIVCDVGMPGHGGLWLAEQVRREYPDTALVMVTGGHELTIAIDSLRIGVLDYLLKPFTSDELRASVERGLRWHEERMASRRRCEALESDVRQRQSRMAAALSALEINSTGTLEAMVAMLTLWNRSAAEHARRVATLASRMADALNVQEPERSDVYRASLLHEVGTLALAEDQPAEPGAASPEISCILESSPRLAFELLKPIPFLAGAATTVLSMHEWVDGSGHPGGQQGSGIPIGSRILAAADAFDLLRHPRHLSLPLSAGESLAELNRTRGRHFDPAVLDALAKLVIVN